MSDSTKTQTNFLLDKETKALIKELKAVMSFNSQSSVIETAVRTLAKNISSVEGMNKRLTNMTKRIEALRGVEI
jgi:hypothetical protein